MGGASAATSIATADLVKKATKLAAEDKMGGWVAGWVSATGIATADLVKKATKLAAEEKVGRWVGGWVGGWVDECFCCSLL